MLQVVKIIFIYLFNCHRIVVAVHARNHKCMASLHKCKNVLYGCRTGSQAVC